MSSSPELDRIFEAQADKLRLGMRDAAERINDFETTMALDPDWQPKAQPWWRRLLRR